LVLRIDNPETLRVIEELCRITGEDPETAVSVAVQERLARLRAGEREDRIRETERARLRALVDADVETTNRLHTDDFQLVNPFGKTFTKGEHLGDIAAGDLDYLDFEPASAIVVRRYSDVAVIRCQSRIHVVVGGEEGRYRGWHTNLYENRDGRWQAVWSQMTAIRE
jgi:hypothetical protein